jgi:hypothetical protein
VACCGLLWLNSSICRCQHFPYSVQTRIRSGSGAWRMQYVPVCLAPVHLCHCWPYPFPIHHLSINSPISLPSQHVLLISILPGSHVDTGNLRYYIHSCVFRISVLHPAWHLYRRLSPYVIVSHSDPTNLTSASSRDQLNTVENFLHASPTSYLFIPKNGEQGSPQAGKHFILRTY